MHDATGEGKGCPIAARRLAGRVSLAMVVICGVAVTAEAGRIDRSPPGTPAPAPTLKCPPKIVPKCKPGEKPYCAEFNGKCCRAVSCRKRK